MKIILPDVATVPFHHIYYGGVKYAHYFSRSLLANGVDVEIVSALDKVGHKKTVLDGVTYTFLWPRIEGRRLRSPWKMLFSYNLARYLKKTDFDIMQSLDFLPFWYLHQKPRNTVVFYAAGLEPFTGEDALSTRGLKRLYVEAMLRYPWRYVMTHADAVAAEGDFMIDALTSLGVKKEKIFTLPSGVDLKFIIDKEAQVKTKRRDIGIGESDLVLITVNQLREPKGIPEILSAFEIIKRKITSAKLIIVGAGPLEDFLHQKRKELGVEKDILHFKNLPEEKLFDLYYISDIYISPTRQLDSLISVQEAMACGLPIVSTAQPFLVRNGRNGFVVGIGNVEGLAEGVMKIHDSGSFGRMGAASRRLIKTYDWGHIAKSAIKQYERLIASH